MMTIKNKIRLAKIKGTLHSIFRWHKSYYESYTEPVYSCEIEYSQNKISKIECECGKVFYELNPKS